MRNTKWNRASGVLMPLFMLPGPCGIGVMGKEARDFTGFLSDCGFHGWQVLPIEHTGAAYSPYKCVSAFAGEPMLIDPHMLLDLSLCSKAELAERIEGLPIDFVDYDTVYLKQRSLLNTAFLRLNDTLKTEIASFNPFWIEDYALYMAIKEHFGFLPWYEWPDEALRSYDTEAIRTAKERFRERMSFHRFVQWLFERQWFELKEYANNTGISIIGDIPFYVSEDSAEVWSNRNMFEMSDGFVSVAGVPPDYFNPDGQRWGNPIYDWKYMEREGYSWWTKRMREALRRYDAVRIDHFRGFESYWKIPAECPTAKEGKWVKGPGDAPFRAMREKLGDMPVFAENLGIVGEEVEKLLEKCGFAGTKVIQFGFLGDETHLPHNYPEDCVAYTGTHDNTTLLAWMFGLSAEDRQKALTYSGFEGDWTRGGADCGINKAFVRALFMSPAAIVIIPVQDLLGYGDDTRTNTPGTAEGNWKFRINPYALSALDKNYYKSLNEVFGRNHKLQITANR